MARPLRFRHSTGEWTADRVDRELLGPLDGNLGAESVGPRFDAGGWRARRFAVDNGDVALFAHRENGEGYWMGNTETPSTLWRTDKLGWEAVPYRVARWAQRELTADLLSAAPWLDPYPHLTWFYLPVLMSKDGRATTRRFFGEHAAGLPGADRAEGLRYYERVLHTGVLDEYRETTAGKLGTSERFDRARMCAAMSEVTVAGHLAAAGHDPVPEAELDSGHSLDFRVGDALVEVTRPSPPARRAAADAVAAVKETAATKLGADGQLRAREDALLFVDCSSFPDAAWATLRERRPDVGHRPAVVFRVRPGGTDRADGTPGTDAPAAGTGGAAAGAGDGNAGGRTAVPRGVDTGDGGPVGVTRTRDPYGGLVEGYRLGEPPLSLSVV